MTDFALTAEQTDLRDQARTYLEATPAPSWAALAELGWTGVAVPAELGGAGVGFVEEMIFHEEIGRATAQAPFYSTSVVLPALPADDQARVAAGEASWVLALGPLVQDLDAVTNVAVVGGDGVYELEGAKREVLETTDATRPLGVVSGGEPGRRLASSELLPLLRTRSLAALAAEAIGVAGRALELAVEHARSREQFGRVIGTYQAVAHPLATTYVELELARSLVLRAAWCIAEREPDAGLRAAAAKAHGADVAVAACERAMQVHGGMGFTWEHELRKLYARAMWIRSWEASGAQLRSEVAAYLLGGA